MAGIRILALFAAAVLAGCSAPAVQVPEPVFPKDLLILIRNNASPETLEDNRVWIWLNLTYPSGNVSRHAYVLGPGASDWEFHRLPRNGTYILEHMAKNRGCCSFWGSAPLELTRCSEKSALWLNLSYTPKHQLIGNTGLGGRWVTDC